MFNERMRKDPGPAIGFWKFVIVSGILLSVLRAIMTGKPVSPGGAFPYAFIGYVFYRIARMQPWWPTDGDIVKTLRILLEGSATNPRDASKKWEPAPVRTPEKNGRPSGNSLGRIATAKRKVEVEYDPSEGRRPIREIDVTNRRLPDIQVTKTSTQVTSQREVPQQAVKANRPVVSSVGSSREKSIRTKTVRGKIVGRTKRK